jgi:polyisoprenoid-binding protein YceI
VAEGTLDLKGATLPVTLPFTLTLDGGLAQMQGETVLDRRNFEIGDGTGRPDAWIRGCGARDAHRPAEAKTVKCR